MPFFTSLLSTALVGTFWTSATGSFLISVFAKVATSALVNLILGNGPNGQKQKPFGIETKLQAGDDIPRGAPLGQAMTAGSLVYANTWGSSGSTPNAYLVRVICLSDLPVQALLRVMVNGSWVTLAANPDPNLGYGVTDFMVGSSHYMWIKFYDGTQNTADSYLTSKFGSDPDFPYDSNRKGIGCAYAIVTTRYSETLWQGVPELKFQVQSIPLYDPSKDSSVGGSGPQRWNNPATWGGDGDQLPMVQAYNILRGISYAGKWVYGFQGVTQAQLPDAEWIAQINVCRSTVSIDANTTEPRYRSGGFLTFNTECGSALEAILAACGGRIADCGGIYKPIAGTVIPGPVSITDDDIISTTDAPFNPVKQLADTINGVTATYPDPTAGWEMKSAPAYYRTDLEAADQNRRLLASLTLNNVPYPHQVQRLQKILVQEVRRTRRHQITLPPSYWKMEPNDQITWTSARHGYVSKVFRVNAVVDQPDSSVVIDMVETDPTDYDYDYTNYVTPTYSAANQKAVKSDFARNELLRATDWMTVDDVWGRLTLSQQLRAQAYRDTLRGLSEMPGWPNTVTWPAELPDFTPICDPINRLYEIRADVANPALYFFTTRSSTGTFINRRGYYDTASANTARVTYDPVTGDIEGIICEGPKTNVCLQSATFSVSPWNNIRINVTDNAAICPDGTTSAAKIDATSVNDTHILSQQIMGTAGAKHWVKIHIKAAELTTIRLLATSSGMTDTAIWFDASTGAVFNIVNAPDYWIKQHRDGWWEVNMSYTTVGSANSTVSVRLTSGGSTTFAGTGSDGVYVWGADVRVSETPGFYIPTGASTVTTAGDLNYTQLLAAFFDPDKLSIYVEAEYFGGAQLDPANRCALALDISSAANQIRVLNRSGKPNGLQIEVGGSTVVAIDGTQSGSPTSLSAMAARLYSNDVAVSTDGQTVQTNTSVTLPAFPTMPIVRLGSSYTGGWLNGIIRQIRIFRVLESDEKLKAMVR